MYSVCVCVRSEEHTSELQSHLNLVCRLLLEKKKHNVTCRERLCVTSLVLSRVSDVSARSISALCACRTRKSSSVVIDKIGIFFFFNDTATTEIYTLSLHDALPI